MVRLTLLWILGPPLALAGTNVWTTHGPAGGNVQAVAIDAKDSNTVYVSAGNGSLFKTTDGGAHWNQISGLASPIYNLAADPRNPGTVYAWGGEMFKTADGGQRWTRLDVPPGVASVVLDPRDSTRIYVTVGNAGILKSTDAGASWTSVSSGLQGGSPYALTVDPENPSVLYSGLYFSRGPNLGPVFRSSDGGATWISPLQHKFLSLGLPETNTCDTWNYYYGQITGWDAPPADRISCYSSEADRENEITLEQYLNALENYARRPDAIYFGLVGNVRTLLADPRNPNSVYALTSAGLFMSTDGALTWNDANGGLRTQDKSGMAVLSMDPKDPATLYAGVYGGRLLKTVDGGLSWSETSSLPSYTGFNVVTIDPRDSNTIYAGTPYGFFKTTDAAASWSSTESGLADGFVFSLLVDPQKAGTVYATAGGSPPGIFKTTDAGTTWTRNDFAASVTGYGGLLAIDPRNPAVLYAAGTCCNPPHPTLFKSADGGVTWFTTGLQQSPGNLLIDPRNSNTLYARSGLVGGGIIRSTDGGMTWQSVNAGLGGTPNNVPNVYGLTFDPQDPDTLYCIRSTDGRLFKTTDGAASWNAAGIGWDAGLFHAYVLVADPKNSGTLYAATVEFDCGYEDVCPPDYWDKAKAAGGAGIFKSADGGQSWGRLSAPPLQGGSPGFQTLSIDPLNPDTMYVALAYSSRIFRSTDAGASWSALADGFPTATLITALVVDGQRPSTVYAATAGSGVLAITFDEP